MLVPRRIIIFFCCSGCYFPWLSDYQLTPHFPVSSTRSFHHFHFSTAEKKTMERVIGLESIVETKDLAVSQTKSHILRQNKLGFSWYRDNSNIMSNTTHDKYVFCMLYVCIYLYIDIDCQIGDSDLNGTLYMWIPSQRAGIWWCCYKKNNDSLKETCRNKQWKSYY